MNIFLPPPPSVSSHRPVQHLRTTDDLLSRFGLTHAYQTHVTMNISANAESPAAGGAQPTSTAPPEKAADDLDDSGDKKSKNSYKSLIKAMPGKHSFKKDDYLVSIISQPPKEEFKELFLFENRTLEGFEVSAEGLKGWNATALVLETKQQREDRKRRKELKKLAKIAHQQHLAQVQQQQQQQQQQQTQVSSARNQGMKRPAESTDPRTLKKARTDVVSTQHQGTPKAVQ